MQSQPEILCYFYILVGGFIINQGKNTEIIFSTDFFTVIH